MGVVAADPVGPCRVQGHDDQIEVGGLETRAERANGVSGPVWSDSGESTRERDRGQEYTEDKLPPRDVGLRGASRLARHRSRSIEPNRQKLVNSWVGWSSPGPASGADVRLASRKPGPVQ